MSLDPDSAWRGMHPYADAGFTTFDMADHYGSAELIAGALGTCRDDVPFLTASGDLGHHLTHLAAPYPVKRSGMAERVSTGTPWEALAGYSRAVRKGDRIYVAGTTASHGDRVIGGRTPPRRHDRRGAAGRDRGGGGPVVSDVQPGGAAEAACPCGLRRPREAAAAAGVTHRRR